MGVHMGNRLRSCCFVLKKSFRLPSMTSSGLFKLSFLVMKCFKNLNDDSIHKLILPLFFLPQELWEFGRLATFVSVQGVAMARAQHWNSNVSFFLVQSLRHVRSPNWLLNFALCRWRDTWMFEVLSSLYKLGSLPVERGNSASKPTVLRATSERVLSGVVLPKLTLWLCTMGCLVSVGLSWKCMWMRSSKWVWQNFLFQDYKPGVCMECVNCVHSWCGRLCLQQHNGPTKTKPLARCVKSELFS